MQERTSRRNKINKEGTLIQESDFRGKISLNNDTNRVIY
jgi:hypothetical protein